MKPRARTSPKFFDEEFDVAGREEEEEEEGRDGGARRAKTPPPPPWGLFVTGSFSRVKKGKGGLAASGSAEDGRK